MNTQRHAILPMLLSVSIACLPGAGLAQAAMPEPMPDSSNPAGNPNPAVMHNPMNAGQVSAQPDRQFLIDTAQNNLTEIKLSQLALMHSHNAGVQSLAKRLIQDHTAAASKLAPVAGALGLAVPTSLTDRQQARYEAMQQLNGTAFDAAYLSMLSQAHRQSIERFSAQARGSDEESVRNFAASLLPTLRTHEQMVQQVALNTPEPGGAMSSAVAPTASGAMDQPQSQQTLQNRSQSTQASLPENDDSAMNNSDSQTQYVRGYW